MDRILQSDIDILVLRHLAAYSCTETARCLVKEKPELRTYIQMQGPMAHQKILGGCTPATDSIHMLRSSTLVHSSLKDIISEYANAKAIVKQLTESIVFEWQALKYDEINSQDSIMTQLRTIGKLIEKICRAKPEMHNESTSTTDDGILPLSYGSETKNTVNAEVQTMEIEEEAVQLMFYNNFLSNTDLQEKIADSINEQFANPQNTKNDEVVVKTVCSKTESEIDTFLREMLQDTDTEGGLGSSSSLSSSGVKEHEYVEVEQNFISMFNDAQSIIESNQGTAQGSVGHSKNSAQKQRNDVVEMFTTPSKVDIPSTNSSSQNTGRKPSESAGTISERYIAPCGKTFSVVTLQNSLTKWGRLGRRQIVPKLNGSANKRKAKFATPVKLTPIKAHASSVNYRRPSEKEKIVSTSPENNVIREVSPSPSDIEIIDVVQGNESVPTPKPSFIKPDAILNHPPSLSTFHVLKKITATPEHAPMNPFGSLVRPVVSFTAGKPFSPIRIVRPEFRTGTLPSLSRTPSRVSTVANTIPQLPISIFSPASKLSYANPAYSPITPVASDNENPSEKSRSESNSKIHSECKETPKEIQLPDPKRFTPHRTPGTSAMSPFLRKLVTSAQKAKSALAAEVDKPNKKSYSTPRKKNHVRNLHFKTPPSLGKVVNEVPSTSKDASNPLKRKGDESTLPRVKSKKRLEWSELHDAKTTKPSETGKILPTISLILPPVPPDCPSNLNSMENLARKVVESNKSAVHNLAPPVPVSKESARKAPKLIIKNQNTVIPVTPPEGSVGSETSSPEIEKPKRGKSKQSSITPPTTSAKRKGRRSKKMLLVEAAKSEACNAVPLGKRGRGRTPRKKPPPRSPLRNILPKPPPPTVEVTSAETSAPKLPLTLSSSTPAVLVLPQSKVPIPTSSAPIDHGKPCEKNTITISFEADKVTLDGNSNSNADNSLPKLETRNTSLQKTAPTTFSVELSNSALQATAPSTPISLELPKTSFQTTAASTTFSLEFPKIPLQKYTSSSSLHTTKNSSSSSLNTPLTTPMKIHISPEIPVTPRLCLSSSTDQDDILKLNYESCINYSQFFATPLKAGNPTTPGRKENPILIDESSSGSIFDTPDKDPNAKPLDLTSPSPMSKLAANPILMNRKVEPILPHVSKPIDNPNIAGRMVDTPNPLVTATATTVIVDRKLGPSLPLLSKQSSNTVSLDIPFPAPVTKPSTNVLIDRSKNKESLPQSIINKNVKIIKPNVKTGFRVSGREKVLTMSEHETVIGLLHMRQGIGSPLTTKLPNQKVTQPTTPATPNKDLQQLLQNANVDNFLQNFVQYKK